MPTASLERAGVETTTAKKKMRTNLIAMGSEFELN